MESAGQRIRIIGGSIAGLSAGIFLQRKGLETNVFEEHSEIGLPEQCSGLISTNTFNDLKKCADITELNKIRNAVLHLGTGKRTITIGSPGTRAVVVCRSELDRKLGEAYCSEGGKIKTGRHVEKHEIRINNKTIIGADGCTSTVADALGFPRIKKLQKRFSTKHG